MTSPLLEALRLVDGDRQDRYGDPSDCMARWAAALSAVLGWPADAHSAAIAMVLLKLVREAHLPSRENRVDAAGYIEIAERSAVHGSSRD